MPLVFAVLIFIVLIINGKESSATTSLREKNFREYYRKTNQALELKIAKNFYEIEKMPFEEAIKKTRECIVKMGYSSCLRDTDYCCTFYPKEGEENKAFPEKDETRPMLKTMADRDAYGVKERRSAYYDYRKRHGNPMKNGEKIPDSILYKYWPKTYYESEKQAACRHFERNLKPEGSHFIHDVYGDCIVDRNEVYCDYKNYSAWGYCHFHQISTGNKYYEKMKPTWRL